MELVDKIKSLPQTEETLRDLFSIAVEQRDFELNKWVRHELRKMTSAAAYELIRKTYIFGAQVSFDDYMIACEWNREPKAQFWLPRRKVLEGKHKIATQIQEFLDDDNMLYLGLSMPPGAGKALANDTPVLTRDGWKKHGDLRVGDYVIGLDGEFKKVTRVFPKAMMDNRIEFTNGESIVCHDEHEWLVHDRKRGKMSIVETQEFGKLDSGTLNKRGHRYLYMLPSRKPVQGVKKNLLDPYTLGVWLGDGVNTQPTITMAKCDFPVISQVVQNDNPIAWFTEHKDTHVMHYGIKGLRQKLQRYDMCHSRRKSPKHIPEEYLTASLEQRLQLLAGLIDTDGTRNGRKYSFSTTEPALRDGIVQLVSTFGWRCCVCSTPPKISTSGIHGRKTVYTVQFTPDIEVPCQLKRKQIKTFGVQRRIAVKNIEKIAPVEGNCIEVEGGIYLVGHTMIPTHNSTLIKFLLAYMCGLYPKSANMYVSYSDGMIKMMLDSLKSILTDEFEYCHNQIFNCGKPTISAEYKTVSYRRPGDFPTVGLVPLGGSVTGRTRANKFLVTDDLVANKEMARSPERLEKLWDDYLNTLTTRMIGDNVKQIQLGTIWSIYDPISRMKEAHNGDPRYKFIAISVYDEETGESNFEYEHPDRYTMPKIMEIKERLDPVDFSCLYMQKGIQREGLALPEDSLKYYNGVLPDGEPDNVVFASDVAWGGGDSYSMPVAYVYGGDVYIHDVIFDKSDKTVTKPRTVAKILSNKCKMGRFEANNGGEEYADDISRILRDEKTYRCNISSKKAPSNMSKVARIEQYVPDIKNFYFLSPRLRSNEYRKFMDEATTFSFTSKNIHDDAIDSLAMLAEYLLEKPNIGKAFKRMI